MYENANDRNTFMSDLDECMDRLQKEGYTEQFKVVKGKLVGKDEKKKYKPAEIKAVNFFRFEGNSNPDDMSILYAIETADGGKGTLVDAYGLYADEETSKFMREVEIHKKVR